MNAPSPIEADMSYPDLDQARLQHAALRDIFQPGTDCSDIPLLRTVETLCRAASAAVADPYCREELGIVADYAAELFSQRSHRKYASESLPGAEFLRLQILKALDSFHSRLYSIEAIRRAAEYQQLRSPGSMPGSPEA
jgi:hypothetical protein